MLSKRSSFSLLCALEIALSFKMLGGPCNKESNLIKTSDRVYIPKLSDQSSCKMSLKMAVERMFGQHPA